MTDRNQALAEIVRIARDHDLTAEEVQHALVPRTPVEANDQRTGVFSRVLGFLGGIFVFAGLCVFVATSWDDMNSAARIIVTLGSGVAAFVLCYLALESPRHEKLFSPLFILASVLQPVGLLVLFSELSSGGEPLVAGLITAGVMTGQGALMFLKTRRTVALFTSLAFGGAMMGTAFDLLGMDEELNGLVVGLALFFLTRSFDRTRHHFVAPFWYLVASILILVSWFGLVENTAFELSFLGLACAFVYFSTAFRSRTLLATGTVSILAYIGDFTSEHFADSIGWPLALIFLGFVMMGLSTAALRIHRRFIKGGPGA